jgi:hypothetical protein
MYGAHTALSARSIVDGKLIHLTTSLRDALRRVRLPTLLGMFGQTRPVLTSMILRNGVTKSL